MLRFWIEFRKGLDGLIKDGTNRSVVNNLVSHPTVTSHSILLACGLVYYTDDVTLSHAL